MKTLVCALVLALTCVTSAYAQSDSPLRPGSVLVLGSTSLTLGRTTFSSPDADAPGLNSNTRAFTAGVLYFVTKNFGIGVIGSHQGFEFPITETDKIEMATTAAGPEVQVRFPVGPRAAFYVAGSGGIAKFSLTGANEPGFTGDTTGTFFGGGTGVSIFIIDSVAFDIGVLYQKSKLKQGEAKFDASGLTVALGFALFFGGR